MFKEVYIEDIVNRDTSNPLTIFLCPNYEERSIHLSSELATLLSKTKRTIYFEIICLRNHKNNDMLLEGLKNRYFKLLCSNLAIEQDESVHWIQYPDNFSTNVVKSIFGERINSYIGKKMDILIDVSTMPRTMIFAMCEAIYYFIDRNGDRINKIQFAYVTPEKYSKIHYAQDIGILNGFFSGRSLRSNQRKAVHSIIFPSRSGHEGKLLLDDLSQIPFEQRHMVFFPIDTKQYLYSLELMRANQTLFDQESYGHQYYCSINDAIIALDTYLNNEVNEIIKTKEIANENEMVKQLYLVAPFGAKIFLPISYFELIAMQKRVPDLIEIDICHAKGFQYTSVYSLGIGTMNIFEMEDII